MHSSRFYIFDALYPSDIVWKKTHICILPTIRVKWWGLVVLQSYPCLHYAILLSVTLFVANLILRDEFWIAFLEWSE